MPSTGSQHSDIPHTNLREQQRHQFVCLSVTWQLHGVVVLCAYLPLGLALVCIVLRSLGLVGKLNTWISVISTTISLHGGYTYGVCEWKRWERGVTASSWMKKLINYLGLSKKPLTALIPDLHRFQYFGFWRQWRSENKASTDIVLFPGCKEWGKRLQRWYEWGQLTCLFSSWLRAPALRIQSQRQTYASGHPISSLWVCVCNVENWRHMLYECWGYRLPISLHTV